MVGSCLEITKNFNWRKAFANRQEKIYIKMQLQFEFLQQFNLASEYTEE